jgi:hypothetical protein
MPLPSSPRSRKSPHTRRIRVDGRQRKEGPFDIEARIVETRDDDFVLVLCEGAPRGARA